MFDPYYKWLAIPPKEQPPNHYRLLGLQNFESDLDVIEGAADRLMSFVRQYQSGEHGAAAAKILNELSVARLCLLKADKKLTYDNQLRQKVAAPKLVAGTAFPVAFDYDAPTRKSRQPKTVPANLSRKWMIIAGVSSVIVLFLVGMLFSRGHQPQRFAQPQKSEKTGEQSLPQSAVGEVKKATSVAEPIVTAVVEPLRTESEHRTPSVNSYAWVEQKLVVKPIENPADLLTKVDLKRDSQSGDWQQSPAGLVGPAGSMIYLQSQTLDDYQLKFVVRRLEKDDSLSIGFVMAGRRGVITFDGWGGAISGLYLDGNSPQTNSTLFRGKLFQGNSAATIVITVHPGHLHASFNGRTIVDWFGDPLQLCLPPDMSIDNRQPPLLKVGDARYLFESVQLIPIEAEIRAPRLDRFPHVVDVIPLLNIQRDGIRGDWSLQSNVLNSPSQWAELYLPTIVPDDYTLSFVAELHSQHQGGYAMTVGLVDQESCFQFVISDKAVGIDALDGHRWDSNETTLANSLLKPGVRAQVDCTVTKEAIRLDVDGRTVIDWNGDRRRATRPVDWALSESRRLYLGSVQRTSFRTMQIGPPLPAPQLPELPPSSIGTPIDLLTLVDPVRDAFEGTWNRAGEALICRGDADNSKLVIPFQPPDEFRLNLKVKRIEGGKSNNESLFIGLPVGHSETLVMLDAVASTRSTIELDRDWGNEAAYLGGPVIPSDRVIEIVVTSRNTGVQVTCDGKTIVDWTGHPERSWCPYAVSTPGRRIALGSGKQGFRFEKIELTPLPPTQFPLAPLLGADGKLLKLINPDRDSKNGKWIIDAASLKCPGMPSYARLDLPVVAPEKYVLSANVERTNDVNDLLFGLVVGGNPCVVTIDGDRGHSTGIDFVDGARFFENSNATRRKTAEPLIPTKRTVPVRCTVLPDTIIVACGGQDVIRWHGDPRRLSSGPWYLPPNSSTENRTHLWLGSWYSPCVFHDLKLEAIRESTAAEILKGF